MSAGRAPGGRAGGATRRRRTRPDPRPVVAVTGAGSGLGALLTARLLRSEGVRRVVALHPPDEPGEPGEWGEWGGRLEPRLVDVCDPALAQRLGDVDVVVHCALEASLSAPPAQRRARNVRGTSTVLTAAAAAGVDRVVLCTSAMVYGALPDNPVPLDEDGPLRALPDESLVGDYLEIERLSLSATRVHPGLAVTVLRPAALVGAGVDSVLTRHFEAPRLLVVRDSRPRWQFCHVEDLVSALELAALGRVEGSATVGCEGWMEQERVEKLSGMHRIELPAAVAFGTAERLHRLGLIPAPASDLQYVVHPWVVPSARLRAAGWRPAYDNETAFGALLAQVEGQRALAARRLGRKDATLGAAGAAVAMVGTAALVRRARRRRPG